MAQVPYTGEQTILPDTRAPDDYSRVQATPAEAGGLIAQGEQQLGHGASAAGQYFGQVAADHATNEYQDFETKLLTGDPNKKNPDGTPDLGYLGSKSRNALDTRQQTEQALDDKLKELREGLQTPEQQLRFDEMSRRYRAAAAKDIGTHADQQTNAWYGDVNNATIANSITSISANAGNPTKVKASTSDMIGAYVKNAELKGAQPGDEVWNAAVEQGKRAGLKAWIDAVGATDPRRALTILSKNQKIAGQEYEPLYDHFKAKADQQIGDEIKTRAIGGATSPLRQPSITQPIGGIPVSYLSAVQQEEGFDPVPRWDVHQWTVGFGTKAAGPDERPSKTDLDQRFATEMANAARTVDEVNPNLDPGTKAALASLTFNTGGAWVHAGLGNAVRAGDLVTAQNLFKQYNNVNGQPNSAIASRRNIEAGWFGQAEPPPGTSVGHYQAVKSSAYQIAMSDPDAQNNPRARQIALTAINQEVTANEIADNQTEKLKKAAVDTAIGGYVTEFYDMLHSPQPDYVALAGRINHDPALADSGPQKEALMERVRRASGEEQSLAFGPGYREARDALFSDPDAPGHLSSLGELANRDDITMAGLEDLNKRLSLAKSSPDRMANEKIINSFLADAQRQMVHDQDIGTVKIPDPKGAHLYNSEFVPRFVKQAAKLQADADKTGNTDKLDKFLSRENVDKMINDVYPQSQRNADRISAVNQPFPAEQVGAPLPAAPEGVDPKGWQALMTAPPVMQNGYRATHQQYQVALQMLLESPTPDVKARFDKWFGVTSGARADDVLAKLRPQAADAGVTPAEPSGATLGRWDRRRDVSFGTPAAAPVSPEPAPSSAAETRRQAIGAAPPPTQAEIAQGQAEIDAWHAAHPPAVRHVGHGPAAAPPVAGPEARREISREVAETQRKQQLSALDQEEKDIKSRDFISPELRARLSRIEAERARLK